MTLFEKYNENGRFNYNAVIENVCIGDCECLDGHYDVKASKSICSKIGIIEEKCKKCWNLEYIEDYVTDTNVGNKSDNVNHPEHYQGKHECIDIMRVLFGDEAVKGFCKCNAFKYRFRAGRKEENTAEQDIQKAEWYEEYLMKMEEK